MFKKILPFLTLFSSFSTLVCCALPALFVSLGLGATFVSFLGAFPQLIWLSEHKILVFSLAGGLLFLTAVLRRIGPQQCPVNSALAIQCAKAKRASAIIFAISVAIYFIGGFFAFIAPYLF